MSIIVNIPESELVYWRQTYTQRYENLVKQIDILEEQIKQMKPMLVQLGIIDDVPEKIPPTPVELNGYDPSWKWLRKIEYLLEKANGRKTSNEIVDEILKREPNESRSRLMNSVPATLSTAANSASTNLKRQKNGKGEYEYWLEEDLPY